MQMTHGNMRYDHNGRKRKPLPKAKKRYTPKFEPLSTIEPYRRETPMYASAVDSGLNTIAPERDYTLDSTVVIGQAYNKGNLVVLTSDEAADPRTGKRR
jgi:hypothetical protein